MKTYTEYKGGWYDTGTPEHIMELLNALHGTRERVRLFYGNVETGKAWHEENDVLGRIGRSTGTKKIPLLVYNARSMGGSAVSTDRIVAILRKGGRNGTRWLYRHSTFNKGEWSIVDITTPEETRFEVRVDGGAQARFKTFKQAWRYVAFMRGDRFSK